MPGQVGSKLISYLVDLANFGFHVVVHPGFSGSVCRFTPTCSAYAKEALASGNFPHSVWLVARRLVRCRPGGGTGFDPVPHSLVPCLRGKS